MNSTKSKLTVFFESPYWKALFERETELGYELVKVVLGNEPKDYEVYQFIEENYLKLNFKFSTVNLLGEEKKVSFKKRQRKVKKETENTGLGTKAQQAIQLQFEAMKKERKHCSVQMKYEAKKRKFELKQLKKREKRKGH